MLLPSIFGNDIFDTMMSFPRFDDLGDVDRKLYGKNADRLMKTDVREHEDHFEVDIDLPGFAKDEIELTLQNGYLVISAAKGLDKEEKSEEGKLIRQERYAGSMQRSYFVGKDLTEEDIKAKFENGVLSLNVPKKEPQKAVPERKHIAIEG
ncbi:Hsp20/alpha crystallin family protein [Ruminococcus sp.]|uniref:Hsp20/alpha crystallin family protein n=1 Tax=Ruminococcus sp. TaxID=41978 RepID=UPI0025D06268|nr:Hsp20/alpha crystallin family protein [Ruminococcus sp.]MBQ8965706.1 Hsp20/alpha crystallin family protein [Ruminococcus sp.]